MFRQIVLLCALCVPGLANGGTEAARIAAVVDAAERAVDALRDRAELAVVLVAEARRVPGGYPKLFDSGSSKRLNTTQRDFWVVRFAPSRFVKGGGITVAVGRDLSILAISQSR
jgi:hypothetical protein